MTIFVSFLFHSAPLLDSILLTIEEPSLHKAIDERCASRLFGERHGSSVTDSSEQVAQLKFQGLGKQVALLAEVGKIVKPYVMIDAVYRGAQMEPSLAIAINDLL